MKVLSYPSCFGTIWIKVDVVNTVTHVQIRPYDSADNNGGA